jgi:PAS domain S-box-containing protein
MRKKIVIAVGTICLIFLLGGTYIIITTEIATSKLDHLIVLHQVEILREQLLIHAKKVQSDLNLRNTPHASGIDTVIANVRSLEKIMVSCFECHRSGDVRKKLKVSTTEHALEILNNLSDEIDGYKESLSRFLTMRANHNRTEKEYNMAFQIAKKLVTEINNMVHMTSLKLSEKTQSSYRDISSAKFMLYALVIVAPFFVAGLGLIFIRELTKPIKVLLRSTRKLKGGDLDYKIEGLQDEFGEVATSFNEMSDSLKEHMHQIQESETRYRMLFESAADAIFILEAEGEKTGKIMAANPAAAAMHGYTVDELLALNIADLDTPDAAKMVPERAQRILAGEWLKTEINHRKKDGTVFPVEISSGLLVLDNHKYFLAFDRDMTERKQMENLLLQSKLEWEDTFDTIIDMITIHDRDFNIIRANKAAQKILKLPLLDEMKVKCYQYYHGKTCPPEECRSCESMETGEPVDFEMFEPHLDMFLEIRAIPRFDDNNRLQGLVHVIRDITERKKVEMALQRAEQMKLVGEWATTLAHEIKNPLAGIKVSVEVLLDELNLAQEDRKVIYKAVEEIKRIELLLKSLLNFAKPPKPQLGATDINDLLDKTIAFSLKHPSLSSNTRSAVSILKEFDERLPVTLADPMQLQQVFLNLLFNGIEAMPDGGQMGIRTIYDAGLKIVHIEISDSGAGIAKEKMDRIFQPFFTTKKKGSGLGLAISRRLIEQHGGEITVKSQTGKRAVFKIVLPLQEVVEEGADEKQE